MARAWSRIVAGRRVLELVRGRFGRVDVNWTPDFMGFGNQLYLWCWAWQRRDAHPPPKVLVNERSRVWLPEVPAFAERFLLERSQVRFLDQRGNYWAEKERISGYPQGFSPQARSAFVREALLPEPLLAGVADSPLATDASLTVVVRRGDFYVGDWNIDQFAFDVATYVELAVAGAVERDGPVERVHVVSDDLAWCRERLGFLAAYGTVTTPDPSAGPTDHFRDVCGSRRLIITNGTFCVWGAFVSREVHGQDPGLIWAPAFFQSRYGPGRCVEYDADFSFVDELPGGWQPDWVLAGRPDPRPVDPQSPAW